MKNTLFLYLRMIVVMVITFYTARVVLDVLGFQEYGLYNLVGGVIVLFAFINGSMSSSTQRYLCMAIGREDAEYERRVFTGSLTAYALIVLAFVAIAETAGLWFVTRVLNIPPGLEKSALIVYQIAIFTGALNIIRMPFDAAVIANERMSFYALSSVIEACLKLAILVPLIYISTNKLVLYSCLTAMSALVIAAWYMLYVGRHFRNCRFSSRYTDRELVKGMLKFTGWNSFSSIANIGARQGMSFILNIFRGVVINAALGVMTQVTTAVFSFTTNFQLAMNPPLLKLYAQGDMQQMCTLYVRAGKFSFYLMLLLSIPIILNINPILEIWLGDVPEYTNWFCALSLVSLLPNVIGGPIWTLIQGAGKLSRYQTIISFLILMNLPLDWILLHFGAEPYLLLGVTGCINALVVVVGICFVKNYIGIKQSVTYFNVILPCFWTAVICFVVCVGFHVLIGFGGGVIATVITIIAEGAICGLVIMLVGLTSTERRAVVEIIKKRIG